MTRPPVDGYDVSHWQGRFPWDYSATLGHRLAACKATQGVRGVDPMLGRNRSEMSRIGFRWRGLYHWVTGAHPIADQVAHFVRTVGALEPGEMVQLDCEESPSSGAPRKLTSDEIVAAWVAFERVYPGRCVLYAGRFYNAWHAQPTLAGVPWWLPWYGPDSWAELLSDAATRGGLPWEPTVWQWGGGKEGAVVPGVVAHGGRCDSNQIIRADVLDRVCGLASAPTIPTPTEDDMPAKLIRVDGDAAQYAELGFEAVWGRSPTHIAEKQGTGAWSTEPARVVTRSYLKTLKLVGDEPDYTGVDPAAFPVRTGRADFAPEPRAVLSGSVTVGGDLTVTGR